MKKKKFPSWFCHYFPPSAPVKPKKKIDERTTISKITADNYDSISIHEIPEGTERLYFEIETKYAYDSESNYIVVSFYTDKEIDNPYYQAQLADYKVAYSEYKKHKEEWKELKEQYDEEQKQITEEWERKKYEQLKAKFEK